MKVAQKQILTPGLVQMVTILQLNRLELKEMITQEMVNNPVLEETLDGSEEISPEELQPLLEAERATADPSDKEMLEAADIHIESEAPQVVAGSVTPTNETPNDTPDAPDPTDATSTDPFDEIDFGSFFDDYLDPGYKTPAAEASDKPSFETFLSQPQTLPDYLRSQLSLCLLDEDTRDAADTIIGNLDEDGYLIASMEEMSEQGGHPVEVLQNALRAVQKLDPAGVAARDLRECLQLQIESRNGRGGVAWHIVTDHLRLLEPRQFKELAKAMNRPQEHIDIAVNMIRHLNPRPGMKYSGPGERLSNPIFSSFAMVTISSFK